ncbi:MAG: 2-C-methyl-D-erythritol 4-phosphate cytidylyltransferase, partial [Chlamydiota bacterium]
MKKSKNISCILLAGGKGTRFGSFCPKQFLPFRGKPLILHSFDLLQRFPFFQEIIVVCEDTYHSFFSSSLPLFFASPGERRQDSVWSALQKVSPTSDFVCIHDGARPFLTLPLLEAVINAGIQYKAATLAVRVTSTIKESSEDLFVKKTHPRQSLWEIQTPQVISTSLLHKAFLALDSSIEVTDDVSLIERLSLPVKIVESSPKNMKITHPIDLQLA